MITNKMKLLFVLIFFQGLPAWGKDSLASIQALETEYEQQASTMDSYERLRLLDDLALRKMDFVAQELRQRATLAIVESSKSPRLLAQHQAVIEKAYQEYLRLKPLYGTPKDFQRTAAYRQFIQKTFALFDFVNDRKSNSGFTFESWKRLAKAGWTVAPTLLTLAASAEERQSPRGFSKIMKSVRKLLPLFFRDGLSWKGSELITSLKNQENRSGEVNIIIMNHSERHLDNVIMSAVIDELPGFSAIIALAQGWNQDAVADVVMKNKSIVSVGQRNGVSYNKTTERVMQTLQGGVRNLFLYPEGSTGSGIGELKPLAPGFARRLLPAISAKYKVNLLLMTTLDTYRMLGTLQSEGPARVIVGPLLPDTAVRSLLASGPGNVDNFIRDQWRENLSVSPYKVDGQFKISDLMGFIDKRSKSFSLLICRRTLAD